MSAETGFSLPDSHIFRTLAVSMVASVLAVGYAVVTEAAKGNVILLVALGLAAVDLLIYVIMKANKLVFLSAEGLKGRNSSGRMNFFTWSAPVNISTGSFSKLMSLRLEMDSGEHIFVPVEIAKTQAFLQRLRESAPKGHPLLVKAEELGSRQG